MPIKPQAKVTRSSTPKKGYENIVEPQVEVGAWSAREDGLDPTQVHLIFHFPAQWELPPIVIAFKSPDTIGFIIEELIKFRRFVWKDCKKVEGEK